MDFTVLNLNVWHGLFARTFWRAELLQDPATRERRFAAIEGGIRELAPDVVTLQECFPQPAFGQRIARALGYEDVSRVSNAGLRLFGIGIPFGVKTGEGLSILARPGIGLRSLGGKNLSGFGWNHGLASLQPVQKRCALAAEVTIGGKTVVVVTAHLRYEFSTEDDLARAWRELREARRVEGEVPARVLAAVRSGIATRDAELAVLEAWCASLETRAPLVLAADMNLDDEAPSLRGFVERLKLTSVLAAQQDARRTWDPVGNPNVARSFLTSTSTASRRRSPSSSSRSTIAGSSDPTTSFWALRSRARAWSRGAWSSTRLERGSSRRITTGSWLG